MTLPLTVDLLFGNNIVYLLILSCIYNMFCNHILVSLSLSTIGRLWSLIMAFPCHNHLLWLFGSVNQLLGKSWLSEYN